MARFIEELTLKVKAHYIAKGLKLGLAQSGIEVGKGKGHAAARAWIKRKSDAMAQGKPFDEPFPSAARAEGYAIARAWNERRLKAQADGEPFNEPYPFPFDEPEN